MKIVAYLMILSSVLSLPPGQSSRNSDQVDNRNTIRELARQAGIRDEKYKADMDTVVQQYQYALTNLRELHLEDRPYQQAYLYHDASLKMIEILEVRQLADVASNRMRYLAVFGNAKINEEEEVRRWDLEIKKIKSSYLRRIAIADDQLRKSLGDIAPPVFKAIDPLAPPPYTPNL